MNKELRPKAIMQLPCVPCAHSANNWQKRYNATYVTRDSWNVLVAMCPCCFFAEQKRTWEKVGILLSPELHTCHMCGNDAELHGVVLTENDERLIVCPSCLLKARLEIEAQS